MSKRRYEVTVEVKMTLKDVVTVYAKDSYEAEDIVTDRFDPYEVNTIPEHVKYEVIEVEEV